MLYPLTIAIVIVAIASFTLYVFRAAIARLLGRTHRQVRIDKQEVRREYDKGFKQRD